MIILSIWFRVYVPNALVCSANAIGDSSLNLPMRLPPFDRRQWRRNTALSVKSDEPDAALHPACHFGATLNRKHRRVLRRWRGVIVSAAIVATFIAAFLIAPKTAKEVVLPLCTAALIWYHYLATRQR